MLLKRTDRILFIGDSITDVGRNRLLSKDLGEGYPKMIATILSALYPELQLTFFNRGISGNQIEDLAQRWQKDCLALKPDIVSILIGVNDTWHHVGRPTFGTQAHLQKFEDTYRKILQETCNRTNAKIVILEPFLLHYPADRKAWRLDFDPRREIITNLAAEFATHFIKLDELFNKQAVRKGEEFLTGHDGVHPTLAGHRTITKAWMEIIENE